MGMKRLALWPLAGLLLIVGLVLTIGGGQLISLGGSFYYLPAALACLVSGGLLLRGKRLGALIYAVLFLATLVWALVEVGPHFWLLLPRLGGPLVILLYMFSPWVGRYLGLYPPKRKSFHTSTRQGDKPPKSKRLAGLAAALVVGAVVWFGVLKKDTAPEADVPLLAAEEPTEWADYAGNKAGTRFSPATQITPANVSELKLAWSYRTGDMPEGGMPQMFQATPLQIGDTLYLCTPHNVVVALDADSGEEHWRHDPKVDATGVYTVACRGVAYHQSNAAEEAACAARIISATIDGRMFAVDAKNGERCADFGEGGEISLRIGLGDVKPGVQFVTSPPTIIGNAAVVGGFVLDNIGDDVPSGVVRAYDVVTGEKLWSWDPGREDPNHVLADDDTYTRGSPNAWSLFSADEDLGLVYIPTGNPSPDHFGGNRSPEMERYGSAVVALEAATGKLRWVYQTVRHDLWDYDIGSQPLLVDMPIDGKTVPALIQLTKQGEIFLFDRRDGTPISEIEEMPVPRGDVPGERYAATQPVSRAFQSLAPPDFREADMWGATPLDQLWCRIAFRKMNYQGRYTPPSLKETLIFPGNNGIMNWGSAAVDTARGVMVVPTSYMPLKLKLIPRAEAPQSDDIVLEGSAAISPMKGVPYAVSSERPFLSPLGIPCNQPPWGRLTAIDLKSREILWQRPLGTTRDHAPFKIPMPGVFNQGGGMMTAGGLFFIGATIDDYLRAFDVKTGKELWKVRLPAGGQALPMSYVSPKSGRQYVVIAAGGHAFMQTTPGDYVQAYSLEGASGAR